MKKLPIRKKYNEKAELLRDISVIIPAVKIMLADYEKCLPVLSYRTSSELSVLYFLLSQWLRSYDLKSDMSVSQALYDACGSNMGKAGHILLSQSSKHAEQYISTFLRGDYPKTL